MYADEWKAMKGHIHCIYFELSIFITVHVDNFLSMGKGKYMLHTIYFRHGQKTTEIVT